MKYQATIGLEIHAELATKTKMFCSCVNATNLKPNTSVCPLCLGLPGSLPVPNLQAVKMTLMIAKALNCQIASLTKWDRKNYFYPDLPKGYQISQYDTPLATEGKLPLPNGKAITITRVHLEEDTGKLVHPEGVDYSLVDFNRSGIPLVELVTEPVIESAADAKAFAQEYQLILRYLGVSDADMEKGQMRVEANISVSKDGKLGTKVEVKNLNSFKSVERAIDYEIKRQIKVLDHGDQVIQETRGFDIYRVGGARSVTFAERVFELGETFSQRTKETASDYRYFPEPDLPPIKIQDFELRIPKVPELPSQARERYGKLGISAKYLEIIVNDVAMKKNFDKIIAEAKAAKIKLNFDNLAKIWVNWPMIRSSNLKGIVKFLDVPPHQLRFILTGERSEVVSFNINELTRKVVKENPKVVEDIRKGKKQAIDVLIGKVMSETRGGADPQTVKKIVEDMI